MTMPNAKPKPSRASSGAPRSVRAMKNQPDPAAAHQQRIAGRSWDQIAEAVGYRSGKIAQMAVTAYLQKAAAENGPLQRQADLHTELHRLDALHASLWPAAIGGDLKTVNAILKIAERRAKLLGLEHTDKAPAEQQRSIIIGGSTPEYLAALKRACGVPEDEIDQTP